MPNNKNVNSDDLILIKADEIREKRDRAAIARGLVGQGSFMDKFFNADNTVRDNTANASPETPKTRQLKTEVPLSSDEKAKRMRDAAGRFVVAQVAIVGIESQLFMNRDPEDSELLLAKEQQREKAMGDIKSLFDITFDLKETSGINFDIQPDRINETVDIFLNFMRKKYAEKYWDQTSVLLDNKAAQLQHQY